jgi:hypothetical protein
MFYEGKKGGKTMSEEYMHDETSNIDMIELLRDEFMDDPLYKEILADAELRKKLFPDFVKRLHPKKQYTTLEVAEMIGEKDSTVRYYMNTLLDYIQPIRNNRNYRLTYSSIYKLYLVFLYTRDHGRNTNDVKGLLPMFADYPIVEGRIVNDNELSVKTRRSTINEGYLLAFLINLAQYDQTNEEIQIQLHNQYIDFVQTKIKHDRVIQKLRLKEKELSQKQLQLERMHKDLVEIKGILRSETQMRNLEIAIKTAKEKDTLTSKIRKIFKKEEKEKPSFYFVTDDDPKIQAQKEKIAAVEKEIEQLKNELKELEKEENDYVNQIIQIQESLKESIKKVPRLKNNQEIASLLSLYTGYETTDDDKKAINHHDENTS